MKKKRHIISNMILVVALAVFGLSAYKLYSIYAEYDRGEKEYDHLREQVVQVVDETHDDDANHVSDTSDDGNSAGEDATEIRVDFAELKAINADVVAWLRFDEPSQISYPVVWSDDEDKYLHTTFEGKRNSAGTLFVDSGNNRDFSDRNTFIHGHNMKNGSMFGKLRKYKNASFCEKYPFFYIHTPDGNVSTYRIFATCVVRDDSETYNKWYNSDEEFEKYVNYVQQEALYQTGVEVAAGAKIVSLSTCTNVDEDERLVVHGVKVAEGVQ